MDKKGAGILISCIVSALLIVALLIVTIRFTQPSCELIIIEPGLLRSSALTRFAKIKPTRSQDKSMLFKIAAHLEYFSQTPSSQPAVSLASQSTQSLVVNTQDYNQQAHQVFGQQQQQQQQVQPQSTGSTALQAANPSNLNQQQQVAGNQQNNLANSRHLNNGPTNFGTNNQVVQNSTNNLASSVPTSASLGNNLNDATARKFLPLELEQLDMKKIDSTRYIYTLKFNCSQIEVTFVRNTDRVYVSAMSIDMKLPSRGKNKCEVQLPSQGVFDVKVYDGLAHYYCSRPLRYSCYHYSSKNPGQPGSLLADLHINSIEFETGGNSSHPIHKSHEFQSIRKECDNIPGA